MQYTVHPLYVLKYLGTYLMNHAQNRTLTADKI